MLPIVSVCTVLDAMRAHYGAAAQPQEAFFKTLGASEQELAGLRAALLAVCGSLMEARVRLVGSFRPEDVQVSVIVAHDISASASNLISSARHHLHQDAGLHGGNAQCTSSVQQRDAMLAACLAVRLPL